jgi:hypothetical protein
MGKLSGGIASSSGGATGVGAATARAVPGTGATVIVTYTTGAELVVDGGLRVRPTGF